jgi:hypothetical protein
MPRNLVNVTVTKDQSTNGQSQITQFKHSVPGLITLAPGQRKKVPMMGPKSVYFGRGVIQALQQNADIVPRTLDVAGAAAKLESMEHLLPLLTAWQQMLQHLLQHLQDTYDALGSDVMVVANKGFQLMKSLGKEHGMEEITKGLGYRYAKPRRKKAKADAVAGGEKECEV